MKENSLMTHQLWPLQGFVGPHRIELPGPAQPHHLRPIHPDDTELDMVAVMGSRDRLWSIYGEAWGWPSATMTSEADREDLARHAQEMTGNESFNFALFDDAETALLGCVYVDPPERVGADAEISWWVIDDLVGGEVEQSLDSFVPKWIAEVWPMRAPRYVGRDLSWADWLLLPEL